MSNLLFPLLLVVLLVPMFLGVRRQKREAQKVTEMQQSVKVGDQIITTSGLYGTVVDLDDESVDLEIAEDVVTTWLRAAIREVRPQDTSTTVEGVGSEPQSAGPAERIESADKPAEPAAEATEPEGNATESLEDVAAHPNKD
ncbi:MAG: preprotein translocase subunit YajC [Nocardia sp.]|nr:preprotein translocase subunit YajC [Nocardia sp.]